jgi:hypothetical protein
VNWEHLGGRIRHGRLGAQLALGVVVLWALVAVFVPAAREPLGITVLVYVALVLGLVVHELGHCVAAWLCRCRVIGVQFGSGPFVAWFKVKDRSVECRLLPFLGFTFVTAAMSRRKAVRITRGVVVALGGVIANALFVVAALLAGGPTVLTSVLVAGNALGVLNLIPMSHRDAQGKPLLSDGALVIHAFQSE